MHHAFPTVTARQEADGGGGGTKIDAPTSVVVDHRGMLSDPSFSVDAAACCNLCNFHSIIKAKGWQERATCDPELLIGIQMLAIGTMSLD